MIVADELLVFVGASLLLLVSPGPAVLYVVAESLDKGRRAGVVASAGLTAGNLVHVAAAVVGLSALLVTSSVAFATLRYAGAAYLVFLGVRQLRRKWSEARAREDAATSRRPERPEPAYGASDAGRSFRRGFVVNVLNPKIALFFLAFLPQFVDPARGSAAAQLALLGLVFAGLTLAVDVAYALAAGTAGHLARGRWSSDALGPVATAAGYVPGLVYIGLGVAAAVAPIGRR